MLHPAAAPEAGGGGAELLADARGPGEDGAVVVKAMKDIGYETAGTLEFLVDREGNSTPSR